MIKQLFSLPAIFLLTASPFLAQLDFWNKPKVTAPSAKVAVDRCMKRMEKEVPIYIKRYSDPNRPGAFLRSTEDVDIEILEYKCKVYRNSKFKDLGYVVGYLLWLETPLSPYWGTDCDGDPCVEKGRILTGDDFKWR